MYGIDLRASKSMESAIVSEKHIFGCDRWVWKGGLTITGEWIDSILGIEALNRFLDEFGNTASLKRQEIENSYKTISRLNAQSDRAGRRVAKADDLPMNLRYQKLSKKRSLRLTNKVSIGKVGSLLGMVSEDLCNRQSRKNDPKMDVGYVVAPFYCLVKAIMTQFMVFFW